MMNNLNITIIKTLLLFLIICTVTIADHFPSEMPENQVFSIDTLIDATGFVTEDTSLNWEIDHQDLESQNGVLFNGVNWGLAHALTPEEITAFSEDDVSYTTSRNPSTGVVVLVSINIPVYQLDKIVSSIWDPSVTYQDYLDYLTKDDWYTFSEDVDNGRIHDGKLNPTEEIAILTWIDSIRTDGGRIAISKNTDFDSQNKTKGLSNLDSEKVLTYISLKGSHLVGSETWNLDGAGNYEYTDDTIRCVFASPGTDFLPAFCNVVAAKSDLVNMNHAQVSTKGSARNVAASADVPTGLKYQIAVTPDTHSGSEFADGTVKTLFGGSIMEAREDTDEPSATNAWKDTASVIGGITSYQKSFGYESGFSE